MDLASQLTCNASQPLPCGFHGKCSPQGDEYKCVCEYRYDPLTNCSSVYLDQLNNADIALGAVLMAAYLSMLVFCIIDLVFSTDKCNRTVYRPISPRLMSKLFLILYLALGCMRNTVFFAEGITETPLPHLFTGVATAFDAAALSASFAICILSWIYIIESAKGASKKSDSIRHSMPALYWGAWITICGFVPGFLISNLVSFFHPDLDGARYCFYLFALLTVAPAALVFPFYLGRAFLWLRSLSSQSRTLRKAQYKTLFLALVLVGYWLILIQTARTATYPLRSMSAWPQFLWSDILTRAGVGLTTSLGLALFATNYRPGHGFSTATRSVRPTEATKTSTTLSMANALESESQSDISVSDSDPFSTTQAAVKEE